MIAVVERLPRDRYDDRQALRRDLEEMAHVHAREVAGARTYDEFLAVVLRHVGDVRHATKDAYGPGHKTHELRGKKFLCAHGATLMVH